MPEHSDVVLTIDCAMMDDLDEACTCFEFHLTKKLERKEKRSSLIAYSCLHSPGQTHGGKRMLKFALLRPPKKRPSDACHRILW